MRFSDLIVSLVICDHLGHSGMFENYINCIIRFLRQRPWRPSWIFDRNNFSYFFYLQVILMLPTKIRVNWLFGSEEEAKNRFSKWRPCWISDRNDFSYVWNQSPRCFLPSFNWPFAIRRRSEQDGDHLGYLIGTILGIFDVQVVFRFRRRSEK